MKRKLVSPMVLLVAASFGPAVFPQYQEPTKVDTGRYGNPTSTARILQDSIFGVIKKINPSELVLEKTAHGIDQPIKLEPKTKYVHDGKSSSLASLKVGDQVNVLVKKNKKTGELSATKVYSGLVLTPGS
jgi:Domain of unknown function (DUF5666)